MLKCRREGLEDNNKKIIVVIEVIIEGFSYHSFLCKILFFQFFIYRLSRFGTKNGHKALTRRSFLFIN